MVGPAATPEGLACGLLIRAEARQGMRYAARCWQNLAPRSEAGSLQKKALTAVQSGLATWQLKQDSRATTASTVAASLSGGKPELPSSLASTGLFKHFALKEMVGTYPPPAWGQVPLDRLHLAALAFGSGGGG